ncbi:hypothetical protein CDIK_2980 [Cucumispora dikerogammari]|nr:hypothetical protein CDIK_2980 [Cucumispora dikerogammari]
MFACVDSCLSCKRKLVSTLTLPLVSIVRNFIRERLIVDTIDLSEYANLNNEIKYVFTMLDSFFKFTWCQSSTRKTAAEFLKLCDIYFTERVRRVFSIQIMVKSLLEVQEYIAQKKNVELYTTPYHPQS